MSKSPYFHNELPDIRIESNLISLSWSQHMTETARNIWPAASQLLTDALRLASFLTG